MGGQKYLHNMLTKLQLSVTQTGVTELYVHLTKLTHTLRQIFSFVSCQLVKFYTFGTRHMYTIQWPNSSHYIPFCL